MWPAWVVTAFVVVVFWMVVIAAALALFPVLRRHRGRNEHD